MEWDAIVDELYALPREEFTQARTEWVKRAKASGDKQLASAITALHRPTVAAWLTNQLVRSRTTEVDALAELGSRLRAAHEQLDGAALRELSTRRRGLLTEWLEAIRGLGAELGSPVSDATGRELEAMFAAALAEPAAWHALAGGRLSSAKDVETARDESSWPAPAPGARPRPALVPSMPTEPRPTAPEPAGKPENAALTRARAEVSRTEDALAESERRYADARDAYSEASADETEARQAVAHRRAELIAAEQAEQSARQRARFARRQREDGDRELRDARRRATLARDRLAALEQ